MVRNAGVVRYLIGAHILLWCLSDDPALPHNVRTALSAGTNDVAVSAISIAEVAIKSSLGKLSIPGDIAVAGRDADFSELPFTGAHAVELGRLPWHHRDLFDRMLVAQARVERLALVSVDRRFHDYDVELLPAGPAE